MKPVLIAVFLFFGSVLNSQAEGYGTIRETDTQIIVEYQDDATEEKPDTAQKHNTDDVQPPQQTIEDKKERKPNEVRRQKIESRLAQRAAQRQQEQERRLSGQ